MKPRLLVVSHDFGYRGAPLALLNLARASLERFDIELHVPNGVRDRALLPEYARLGIREGRRDQPMRYDLVIANTVTTDWVVRAWGGLRPVLWWLHEERIGAEYLERQPEAAEAFSLAAEIVVPTRQLRDVTYAPWLAARATPARVISNTAYVDGAEKVPAGAAAADRVAIVQIGSAEPLKGHDVMLRALALLEDPRVTVDFIGARPRFRGEVAELAARPACRWLGALPHAEALARLRGADILCQPSREEAQGIAILEAMACGKAVAASDLPAIREVVRHGDTGLLSPPGDAAALAASLRALAGDPALRTRMGARGREVFEAGLSPRVHREAFGRLFDRVLGTEGSGAA